MTEFDGYKHRFRNYFHNISTWRPGRRIDSYPTNGASDSEGCGGVELSKPIKLSPMRKVE